MSSPYKQTNAGKFFLSFLLIAVIGANSVSLPVRSSTPSIRRPVAGIRPALIERPHSPKASRSLAPSNPEFHEPDQRTHDRVKEAYGNLPLSFEINQGQSNSQVKFTSRGGGYKLYLEPIGAVMVLTKDTDGGERADRLGEAPTRRRQTTAADVLRMKFIGANPRPDVTGLDELPGKSNYIIGNDPEKWRTGVPNYAKVKYGELYPGIDVIYYGNQRQLEYDFIVAPGADARAIKLSFEGTRKLHVDRYGDLTIVMNGSEIRQHRPVAYQDVKGHRRAVKSRFVLTSKKQVAIEVGA
jgi:hypothetical protein